MLNHGNQVPEASVLARTIGHRTRSRGRRVAPVLALALAMGVLAAPATSQAADPTDPPPVDLALTVAADQTYTPGQEVTFLLTVRNAMSADGPVSSGWTLTVDLTSPLAGMSLDESAVVNYPNECQLDVTTTATPRQVALRCVGGELGPQAATQLPLILTTAPEATTPLTVTATLAADQPEPDTEDARANNTASASVQPGILPAPGLFLAVRATPGEVPQVGDEVTFSFDVLNNGNTVISDLAIAVSPFSGSGTLGTPACPKTTLAPAETMTCALAYVLTQPDIDAGLLAGEAVVTGQTAEGIEVTSLSAVASLPTEPAGALSLEKTAEITSADGVLSRPGDGLEYTFTVTNTGNVTLSQLAIGEDSFTGSGELGTIECEQPLAGLVLPPGATVTCAASYALTQEDVDAGLLTNVAEVAAVAAGGANVTDSDFAIASIAQRPGLTLAKSVSPTNIRQVDNTLTYTFEVTNPGNVTVNALSIEETSFSGTGELPAPVCDSTVLAPGASTVCTVDYVVTQADVDSQAVANVAVATGQTANGVPVTSEQSDAVVIVKAASSLALAKSVSPSVVAGVGAQATYSFEVTNTGALTVVNLAIDERSFGGAGQPTQPSCPTTTLAPGESTTCTAGYTVTQADLDAGSVANAAVATGQTLTGATVASAESAAVLTVNPDLRLHLEQSVSPATVTQAGVAATFSFAVTNASSQAISGLAIDVASFSGTGSLPQPSCPTATLAPGASTTCLVSYTVTQADVDAGLVTSTAAATGQTPDGTVTSPAATAELAAQPAVSLNLVAAVSPTRVSQAGAKATYSFVVTNTGAVTLAAVAIAGQSFSGTGAAAQPSCLVTTLAPGASTTCSAEYTVTAADVTAGTVTRAVTATGVQPGGALVTSAASSATLTVDAQMRLYLEKTVSPATVTRAGAQVTYSFAVTNTGAETLTDIAIDERAFSGTGSLAQPVCPATTLAAGASMTCTVSYPVTQADLATASMTNTAAATGRTPGGATVASEPSAATVTPQPGVGLSLSQSVSPATATQAGTQVVFAFSVVNTGAVPVRDLAIGERAFTGSGQLGQPTCPVTVLAPGTSMICTATYTLTAADAAAGSVRNTAVVAGQTATGLATASAASTATVTVNPQLQLYLEKSASPAVVTQAGQTVSYTFSVMNTGSTPLHGLVIDEQTFSGAGPMPEPSCPITTLAPGATATCTASYTVTQEDIENGMIANTASASALGPDESPVVSPESDVAVLALPPTDSATDVGDAALTLANTVDKQMVLTRGTQVVYTYLISNTGEADLTNIVLRSQFSGASQPALSSCTIVGSSATTTGISDLAAGQSQLCTTVPYTITAADIQARTLTNVVYAEAQFGTDVVRSDPSSATTVISVPADMATDLDDPDGDGPAGPVGTGGTVVTPNTAGSLALVALAAGLALLIRVRTRRA